MRKRFLQFLIALLVITPLLSFNASQTNAIGGLLKGTIGAIKTTIDPELEKLLNTDLGIAEVIVTFHGNGPANQQQISLLQKLGINDALLMKNLPIAGMLATKKQIEELAKNSEVRSIYLNTKLEYYNAESTDITGVNKVRTDDQMRKQNGGFPVSGKGIGVVINDSGVDGTHDDHRFGDNLVQNVMGTTNLNALSGLLPVTYVENVINTDTNSGHGTHVAGTVGGTGAKSGGKYEGVAPGANLIGYGSGGALFILDGIGGFDYAITNQAKYGIRVITNSWGSSGNFNPDHPINIASKKAYDRGIVVLFAAGNEGPSENTHNPYAKAPWVISVGAGVKDGSLANFSSRGTKGVGGTFTIDGKEWTWKDEPTITAPGVDIISTRVIAPLSALSADKDLELIDLAYLPYYTSMSGTSMATPHVAGIVALMLEANPLLSPAEVKDILQRTATNMPGREAWEVGAGYVNAYAALEEIFFYTNQYGKTVNSFQTFHSNVDVSVDRMPFSVSYNPVTLSSNYTEFDVQPGTSGVVAQVDGKGIMSETGNPINLVLIAPDGTEVSSGVSLLFRLEFTRTVSVSSPQPGTWKAEIRGLRGNELNPIGIGLPEEVSGTLSFSKVAGFTGLADIAGHPAENAIKLGINERLFDGFSNGRFSPDAKLERKDLAKYLVMGAGIRQSLKESSLTDVSGADLPYVKAVVARGGALRDGKQLNNGVMLTSSGKFNPKGSVSREELSYALVQSFGLQQMTQGHKGDVTVQYGNERLVLEDQHLISPELKGYVQVALDLNIMNAYFTISQGKYDLEPTVHASFKANDVVTRGDFAVAMTRFFNAYLK
ncbi:peptidase S8 [Anaerobacillus alkaliphilus]|uniref:Peptidase S8 n=1 Tax=Anaerobacillus alkaliphilus TaxID=1548597 RepID=A0A4Q0VSZ3_9BACI|nr:S8 family serine peptidase [Anaerobacillus alkaliphilus]RXJ00349.1 peptidase S8 [Anaerobacillus alkaliphilus]